MSLSPIKTGRKAGRASYSSLGGNWRFEKKSSRSRSTKSVFLIVLICLGTVFLADQALKQNFIPSVFGINWTVTNLHTLWSWGGKTGNLIGSLDEFNINSANLVTYTTQSAFGETWPVIQMVSNSSNAALAISKAPTNLDTIAGHQLTSLLTYRLGAYNNPSANLRFGMFLTRNGTFPAEQANYEPRDDKNVAFVLEIHADVAGTATGSLFVRVQRESKRSITSDDPGAVDATGSTFLFMSFTQETVAGNLNRIYALLNYTGNQANANALSRLSTQTGLGDTDDSTKFFPWFQFQSNQYHVGFYQKAGGAGTIVQFFGRDFSSVAGMGGSHFARSDPASSPQQGVPQSVDTGGFFGPVIKALISIGIFIVQSLMIFIGYLQASVVQALNSIGNFVGWGNIGTQFEAFLSGIVSLILQLGTVITWLSSLVQRAVDGITFITTPFTAFLTAIADWFTAAKNIIGFIVTVTTYLIFVGVSAYTLIDFIFYFVFAAQEGLSGFGMWFRWNKWMALSFLGVASRILNLMIGFISAVVGQIPTFSGTSFPRLPIFRSGEIPSFKLDFGMPNIRRGDPISALLLVSGFVVFALWLGSANSPLDAATQAKISAVNNIWKPIVTMGFLIVVFVVPVGLVQRLTGKVKQRF